MSKKTKETKKANKVLTKYRLIKNGKRYIVEAESKEDAEAKFKLLTKQR